MVRSEGDMSLKNPVTPQGIDPGIVRLVAQRLNHYANPGPSCKRTGFNCNILDDTDGRGNENLKSERQVQNQELPFHYFVNTNCTENIRHNMKNYLQQIQKDKLLLGVCSVTNKCPDNNLFRFFSV
jgi:hypothetical protein